MHALGASNKEPKLALIPYFCYLSGGLKNDHNQEIETLLHSNISHRADEKGSNRGFSRLSGAFAGVTGAIIGATMMLSTPAFANDSPSNQVAPTTVAMNAPTTAPAPVVKTDQITRKEAFRASTNQIVYHVGEGVIGMPAEVLSLRDDGYNVSAYMGGKHGQVECWVGRGRCGVYTQDKIFDGTMSGIASLVYDARLGQPVKSDQIASLDR